MSETNDQVTMNKTSLQAAIANCMVEMNHASTDATKDYWRGQFDILVSIYHGHL